MGAGAVQRIFRAGFEGRRVGQAQECESRAVGGAVGGTDQTGVAGHELGAKLLRVRIGRGAGHAAALVEHDHGAEDHDRRDDEVKQCRIERGSACEAAE